MLRLPDPGLVPTSQEAGGMVHDQSLAMTAPGTAPGFDGGSYPYPVATDLPAGSPAPGQSGATVPVPTDPAGQPRDGLGRWTADGQVPGAGPWRPTPSAGTP